MAQGIQTAGEFKLEVLKLVTTSGLEVDLTTSVVGLTLFEDIFCKVRMHVDGMFRLGNSNCLLGDKINCSDILFSSYLD